MKWGFVSTYFDFVTHHMGNIISEVIMKSTGYTDIVFVSWITFQAEKGWRKN